MARISATTLAATLALLAGTSLAMAQTGGTTAKGGATSTGMSAASDTSSPTTKKMTPKPRATHARASQAQAPNAQDADVDRLNEAPNITNSSAHTAHQGAAKNLAKCELVLGVALLMTETLGSAHLPHTQERIGELIMYTELMRACIRAGEADAKPNQFGVMTPDSLPVETTRNLFMTAYPKMAEILQLLGSSSLMMLPTEADMNSPMSGHIDQYLATDTSSARDRVKLFHLAWDISCSSFGQRQVLYERFFASDPLTRARALAQTYPKKEMTDRVLSFLNRDDHKE